MKAIFKGKEYDVVCECDGTEWEGWWHQIPISTTGHADSDEEPVFYEKDKGKDDWCPVCHMYMWIDTNEPL